MGYIIIGIFTVTVFFALFEEKIIKYRTPLYIFIFFLLVLVAGLREVGVDYDSLNYEGTFLDSDSNTAAESVEYSYILFSQIIKFFSNDVHILFLFYALLGVGLKMYAFRKYNSLWFPILAIYISEYYALQECMQIRSGVLSGFLLIAITQIGDGKKKLAVLSLLLGCFFHYSALILLPILFLSNKEMTKKQRIKWGAFVSISYSLFILGVSFLFNFTSNIPYIGNKLDMYQKGLEIGIHAERLNVFDLKHLLRLFLYFYILYFYDTISKYNKYLPLLIKIFSIGLFFYAAFAFFPVFGERVNRLYEVVCIILFANIYYTIRPKWAATGVIFILGLILLNYSLTVFV